MLKKLAFYTVIALIPFGCVAYTIKYFLTKKSGNDITPEETVVQAVNFLKKIIQLLKKGT